WGQYAELSIKRVLTRDGDSTYYINNIPVRRRDIYDLFLGTGLGPRAYAIIEQGMISRVIEAKPEELRIFLEEAAGVSKYRERRKETEGRLADRRGNPAPVEDIRLELSSQLEKLESQARVATEYRQHETRLKEVQELLWFSKQQDAAAARERHSTSITNLSVAFESLQADVRAAEAKQEALRAEHYAAGDALHDRQGAYYAANSEVTRLEQRLSFARESESRISQQAAQLTEQLGALAGQETALSADRAAAEAALTQVLSAREAAAADEQAAKAALPPLDDSVGKAEAAATKIQDRIAQQEQGIRVIETRRENHARALAQLAQRRERLEIEQAGLAAPVTVQIADIEEQLRQETAELRAKEAALNTLREAVQDLQERQRAAGDLAQETGHRLADLDARAQALAALQEKIGQGKDTTKWQEERGLAKAHRLWQGLDVEPGWEDALEAVLRERLDAIEVGRLDAVNDWLKGANGGAPPGRIAVYAPGAASSESARGDALLGKIRTVKDGLGRLLADWLRGVRCRPGIAEALRERASLGVGEAFVTPQGHLVTAQAVNFFAPDSELHGVLARQRELAELAASIIGARSAADAARDALAAIDAETSRAQDSWHAESLAFTSQQRRCHDLELELLQVKQAAEAAAKRRAQIAQELAEIGAEEPAGQQRAGG